MFGAGQGYVGTTLGSRSDWQRIERKLRGRAQSLKDHDVAKTGGGGGFFNMFGLEDYAVFADMAANGRGSIHACFSNRVDHSFFK